MYLLVVNVVKEMPSKTKLCSSVLVGQLGPEATGGELGRDFNFFFIRKHLCYIAVSPCRGWVTAAALAASPVTFFCLAGCSLLGYLAYYCLCSACRWKICMTQVKSGMHTHCIYQSYCKNHKKDTCRPADHNFGQHFLAGVSLINQSQETTMG